MERLIEFFFNHYIYSIALIVVSYLLVQDFLDSAFKKFSKISPLIAVTKMNEDETLILDVREVDEFTKGHIESAVNTPLNKLTAQLEKYEKHKKKPVLITCDTGTRSASAGKILSKAGFENIFVIAGGLTSWVDDYKLPIKIPGKSKNTV